jgi:hypothetical protein
MKASVWRASGPSSPRAAVIPEVAEDLVAAP